MIPRRVVAVALDVVCVVVFVAIGRSSHTEGVTVAGVASTAWPFLTGLALGWLIVCSRKFSPRIFQSACWVWLTTVVVGMTVRVIVGTGIAVAFVAVAFGFLGATFFGWRLIAVALHKIFQNSDGVSEERHQPGVG